MPLTNVLKKRLMKGESTQSGSSRWAALGLILSMTACTSLTAPDNRLPGNLSSASMFNQFTAGTFDAAGQAFTKELGVHSIRVGYNHGNHNFGVNWAAQNGMGVLFLLGYSVRAAIQQRQRAGSVMRTAPPGSLKNTATKSNITKYGMNGTGGMAVPARARISSTLQ